MSPYRGHKCRYLDGTYRLRDLYQSVPVILFKDGANCEVFLSGSSLLGNERIVIVRGDLRSKLGYLRILELVAIGAGSESKIGASDRHVDAN